MGAATGFSHKTGGMAVVNHYHGVVFISQITDFFQYCDITVHAENTIGSNHYEAAAFFSCFFQTTFQTFSILSGCRIQFLNIAHVAVFVCPALSFAKTYPIDDGSMIQSVADNGVVFAKQWFKNGPIGVKT
ncbi:hypothetical protein SDC9_76186 [bioreactor metagenome]|uniref:Uncharacterized protein n=1 Tax=bioreactor metagenome TaxID=1076179 RepID=A0A644YMB4_9ZZZZ